ncbi:MAG: hypothetical protein E7463_10075 [Ruminococcaceae bacterium]|nr:hypothetical protein [Oscillospiraceae bacterium]
MLTKEKKYDFRKRMLEVHKPGIRNHALTPAENEYVLKNGCTILLPERDDIVVSTAAKDFREYLDVSMGIAAILRTDADAADCDICIYFAEDAGIDLEDVKAYMGYRIEIGDRINIYGHDARGIAQALYRLEELMSLRRAPFLKKETIKNKAMFSPRMVHSGYRLDEFPDEHLASIAHAGMDAILVFVKDVDVTPYGFLDFNELIRRAEKYGLDCYVYSYLDCEKHPDDEGAEEYFDQLYGKIFKACPKFKGIILVGESCEFPSKDPRTSGLPKHLTEDHDPIRNVPRKPSPGYFPCSDYPQWLNAVKTAIRRYTPDADIVFWSYNWGSQPEEDRVRLIENLPTDISLLVTFEMYHRYSLGNSTGYVGDYSIAQTGPGDYFVSEAKAAHKRGIRLYTMANTGGLTWDIGTIPYWPVPYQWIRRYKEIIKARDNWGLCGIMESHHYGIWPSFISQLTKAAYSDYTGCIEDRLRDIIRINFSDDDRTVDTILRALDKWSEAITYHPTTNEDQAGSLRIGTAYPLCMPQSVHKQPAPAHTTVPGGWYYPLYQTIDRGRCSIFSRRIHDELRRAKIAKSLFEEGVTILETIADPCEELERLINMGKYICCCEQTMIHVKEWYIRRTRLMVETEPEKLMQLVQELEAIAAAEIENIHASVPMLEVDSRLGWEPSMEYVGSPDRLEWKEKLITYVLSGEISWYKKAISYDL